MARETWWNTSFKAYALASFVILAILVISFFKPATLYSQNDASWAIAFAEVNGTMYALVAAFTILSVLNKFNGVQRGIKDETDALEKAFLVCLRFNQKNIIKKLKKDIIDYTKIVVKVFWHQTGKEDEVEESFNKIVLRVQEFRLRNERDAVSMGSVHDLLAAASLNGADTDSFLASKTPRVLWILLLVLSVAVLASFWVANVSSQFFASLIMIIPAIVITLVIAIIYDLDNPLQLGFWVVPPVLYTRLENHINNIRV